MRAPELLSRLSSQPEALPSLAALTIDSLLDAKLADLAPADRLVPLLRATLAGWLETPSAMHELNQAIERAVARLNADPRPVRALLADDVRLALREVVARPVSPNRKVVLTLIDHPPMRALVRRLLLDSVLDFARKLSAPMSGVAKGLGSLAKLATDSVKSRSGGLGGLMGAVSGEVERQLEKRAADFVDAALSGIFEQLADVAADPSRATEAAQLRVAAFDGAMALTLPELAREVMNADLPGSAELLRTGLSRWLAGASSDADLAAFVASVWPAEHAVTLRQTLSALGVVDAVRAFAVERLTELLRRLSSTPGFATWLDALLGP